MKYVDLLKKEIEEINAINNDLDDVVNKSDDLFSALMDNQNHNKWFKIIDIQKKYMSKYIKIINTTDGYIYQILILPGDPNTIITSDLFQNLIDCLNNAKDNGWL